MSPEEFWDDYWPAAFRPNDRGPTKLAAVYIVLSLGSLFDPTAPVTFNQQALTFFLRSHNIMAAARALSNNTLATSQTIQLSGSFLLCQHDLVSLSLPSIDSLSIETLRLIRFSLLTARRRRDFLPFDRHWTPITRDSSSTSRWNTLWADRTRAEQEETNLLGARYDRANARYVESQ